MSNLRSQNPTDKKSEGRAPRPNRRLRTFIILLAILFIAFEILSNYHLNYYSITPGGTAAVEGQISINSPKVAPLKGRIDLVYVDEAQVTLLDYPFDKVKSHTKLYPTNAIASTPTGILSDQAVISQNAWYQVTSQVAAKVAALNELGYNIKEDTNGAPIGWVDPTAPAAKVLASGDVITAVDHSPTPTVESLISQVQHFKPGQTILLSIKKATSGKTIEASIKLAAQGSGNQKLPYIGIGLAPKYHIPLNISISDLVGGQALGGPSAGLSYALTIVDMLSGGNLTHGMNIACTGTIAPNGSVGPIGGLEEKTISVLNSGDSVFFVPAGESPQSVSTSQKEAGSKLKIYIVSSLQQVLTILQSLPTSK
ncbi:MAG: PDZ domain-containing protein [Acidimicrobiales bacterium]|nr:PDZ domain-containing protein [Acidimicrobiales bacterium]